MKRRHDPPDRLSMAGSLAVHTVVLLLAWLSSLQAREPMVFESYQIEIVSPPPAQAVEAEEQAPAREELVVERPEPEPPPEDPEPAPVADPDPPDPEPEPTPDPPREDPEPAPEEAAEEETPAVTDEATDEARESGENINVRMEGLRRDYPGYYDNIIRQIQRCLSARWRGAGSWETTVYFVIQADGSVTDLDFVRRSGNANFDFEAMGAVECAGRGRFGALPEDLPYERLPVQFTFSPPGGFPLLELTPGHDSQDEDGQQR